MPRKTISEPTFHDTRQPTEPTQNEISATSIILTLPYWSPMRPMIGVATDPVSR